MHVTVKRNTVFGPRGNLPLALVKLKPWFVDWPLEAGSKRETPPPPVLKYPTLQQNKYVYSLVQKVVLVYITNFVLRDNCEGSGIKHWIRDVDSDDNENH